MLVGFWVTARRCATPRGWRASRRGGRDGVARRSPADATPGRRDPPPTACGTGRARRPRSRRASITRPADARRPVAPAALRAVHRLVGALQQVAQPLAVDRVRDRPTETLGRDRRPVDDDPGPATPWRIFSARIQPPVVSVSGSSTTNSSPPKRAAVSIRRTPGQHDVADEPERRSPARWPSRSLIPLRSSMSIISEAEGAAGPVAARELALERAEQVGPGAQPGERVDAREPARGLARPSLLAARSPCRCSR